MSKNINCFYLSDGHTLISEIELENDQYFLLNNPVVLATSQKVGENISKMYFTKYTQFNYDNDIKTRIFKGSIISTYQVDDDIAEKYYSTIKTINADSAEIKQQLLNEYTKMSKNLEETKTNSSTQNIIDINQIRKLHNNED